MAVKAMDLEYHQALSMGMGFPWDVCRWMEWWS